MADGPEILVVGSINMDIVVRSPRMPVPGETILGSSLVTSPGGKGANQAVAVARMGGNCRMIGRVGDDAFGETLLKGLLDEGINCQCVHKTADTSSGVAIIVVDAKGENSIIVASGANNDLTPDDIFHCESAFKAADIVVLQLEIPIPTVRATLDVARRNQCKVILDPAPAPKHISPELFTVDIISPNATEAELLVGKKTGEERMEKQVGLEFIARGSKAAVLKLGQRGSLVVTADGHFYRVPSYKVSVVDTTAAGDAFTGALAVAIGRGDNLQNAAKLANAAGALTCTRLGAQSAIPTAVEVKILMDDQPI